MSSPRRAAALIASVALVSGLVGLVVSRDLGFASARGERIGSLMSFSPLGAIVTAVLAAAALAGALRRRRGLVTAAGVGFAAAAAVQLVQSGAVTNWLGGRPTTFSFFLATCVGLLALRGAERW